MDKLKNQIVSEKSIRLLQQNQYTFQVDSKLTKTEMKNWIEQFFDVEVKGTNSSRITSRSEKKRNKVNPNFTSRRKMIVRLKKNYFIPLFLGET
uniref:Large ribosomal subunit protein uL23c n=1 Tax=Llavea cordifolia TaxID=40966 RepID=A0A3G5CUL6_9MONI|nr:ribosomal protein L23 [Llavea cordifolia]AYW16376.1 ribosomal protein L23 [Llavea cordifolia]